MPLTCRIGGDDLERRRHLLLGGAAADVEEVGGLHAIELDDVHGRHGQAGAVDHAADRAVQRDIGQVIFRRFDFLGVLLGLVAQREDIRMAIERIGVERHLGVEALQLALGGDDQRIDLQHGHVLLDEGLVELGHQNAGLLGEIARKAQRLARRCGRGAA